jgi:mRNA interferase MazF
MLIGVSQLVKNSGNFLSYVPDRGDIIWVDFSSSSGHEQRGNRPALVMSYKLYNESTGLLIVCPITSKIKGYPFEVEIHTKIKGTILVDHLRNIDFNSRKIKFVCKAPDFVVARVKQKINLLV